MKTILFKYNFLTSMYIWDSLRRMWKENNTIKSIAWNTIIALWKNKKKIDIAPYMKSISIKWNRLYIKTNKPIINLEINNIKSEIEEEINRKIKKLWLNFKAFEIITL